MTGWRCKAGMAVTGMVLCAGVIITTREATADAISQVAYARGLIAFHRADWGEALAAFDHAVKTDPADSRARYYRGLVRARLGDTGGAIEDFEAALRQRPDLPHAWLDLGIAYLSAGRLENARGALQRAVDRGQERHVAAFFLGLVLYRSGDQAGALAMLQQARADAEVRLPAMYYEGLIAVQQGAPERAHPLFETVAREAPGTEIGLAAAQFLSGDGMPSSLVGMRRWSLLGRAALEYDSNVTLGPSSVTISTPRDVTEKSDGRIVALAGVRYRFMDGVVQLAGGYDLSQSVHFDLTRFDLQGHRLSLTLGAQRDMWSYGIAAGYNFFALNYQSFFHEGLGTPYVTYRWANATATQAFVSVRARDFLRRPYDPGRDAFHYAPGVRQYVALGAPSRTLVLGYQYEIEDTVSGGPQGRTFAHKGHVLDAELAWLLGDSLRLEGGYTYRRHDYDNVESGFGVRKRKDNAHALALGALYPLTDQWAWTIGYIGQLHNSNERLFEYDRHIVSTGLQVVY